MILEPSLLARMGYIIESGRLLAMKGVKYAIDGVRRLGHCEREARGNLWMLIRPVDRVKLDVS